MSEDWAPPGRRPSHRKESAPCERALCSVLSRCRFRPVSIQHERRVLCPAINPLGILPFPLDSLVVTALTCTAEE